MNRKLYNIIKFSGFVFMIVTTFMFYNHLFTAVGNKKFFVHIYFDYFNEGALELLIFIVAIPFILFTIGAVTYEVFSYRVDKETNKD